MNITNNSGGAIIINRLFVHWVKSPTSQKLDRVLLDGFVIWNTSDVDSPSDLPSEGNWVGGANRTIPNAQTLNLVLRFQNALQPTGYDVHIVFDIGCQVTGAK